MSSMGVGLAILVCFLTLQVLVFVRGSLAAARISKYFSPGIKWESVRLEVSESTLQSGDLNSLLAKIEKDKSAESKKPHFLESRSQLTFIRPNKVDVKSKVTPINRINEYLYNQKGAPPDYTVVHSIVQNSGYSDLLEIRNDAKLPINLGVLGVLLAFVISLFQVDFLVDMPGLMALTVIKTIRIPMILLFSGMLLSMILSHIILRSSHDSITAGKDEFIDFLQDDLLPLAGEDIAAVLHKMKGQFDLFNNTFRKNIEDFNGAMNTINTNIVRQGEFLSKLDKFDLEEIAATNINIFQKLERIMGEFDKFTGLIDQLNSNIENANDLELRLERLTQSADSINLNIKRVGEDIDNKLNLSTEMMRFLKSHFTEMDERKAIITRAVINFDDFMKKSFDQLERHTMERVLAIKDIKIKEEDKLIKALDSSRSGLQQLGNLEKMLEELRNTNQLLQELIAK